MEKIFGLIVDFSKEHGIGLSIPVAIWIVVKVIAEDLRERLNDHESTSNKNHEEIVLLKITVARLEEKINSMEKAVY